MREGDPLVEALGIPNTLDTAASFVLQPGAPGRVSPQTEQLSPPPPLVQTHRKLSRAIKVLRHSSPAVFGVENPGIPASKEWGPAKEAMGQATRRVLPTDQVGLWNRQRLVLRMWAGTVFGQRRGADRAAWIDVGKYNCFFEVLVLGRGPSARLICVGHFGRHDTGHRRYQAPPRVVRALTIPDEADVANVAQNMPIAESTCRYPCDVTFFFNYVFLLRDILPPACPWVGRPQIDGLRRAAEHIAALHASLQQAARDATGCDDGVDQRSACGAKPNGSVGGNHDDAERASRGAPRAQGETEDGITVVTATNGDDAGVGRSSPEKREEGGDGATAGREAVAFPANSNGTRETREDCFGRGNGDSGGGTNGFTGGDPGDPNPAPASPSAAGADGRDNATGIVGGSETAAAVAARGAEDRSGPGAECARNGNGVAAAEDEAALGVPSRSELEGGGGGTSASSAPLEESWEPPQSRPACSGDGLGGSDACAIAEGGERERGRGEGAAAAAADAEVAASTGSDEAMGADDFLPLFALVLVGGARGLY